MILRSEKSTKNSDGKYVHRASNIEGREQERRCLPCSVSPVNLERRKLAKRISQAVQCEPGANLEHE